MSSLADQRDVIARSSPYLDLAAMDDAELSVSERLALLDPERRQEALAQFSKDELAALEYDWGWKCRPDQAVDWNDDSWSTVLFLGGRGSGKLLGLGTMIPTPAGFRKLEELAVGDQVFDEHGHPCSITATFEDVAQAAFRLQFSDSTHLDACADHQWVTWTQANRKRYLRSSPDGRTSRFPADWVNWRKSSQRPGPDPGPRVRTTQEIVDTFTLGKRDDLNHCIPLAGPILTPDATLPLDPWILGYWLGNGTRVHPDVTCHIADTDFVAGRCIAAGYDISVRRKPDKGQSRINLRHKLRLQLGAMGLGALKFVPEPYLWASAAQRTDLLAGLLDSDGYIDPLKHSVEFCSMDRELAEAVLHLARSLGQKPVLATGRATLEGRDYGTKFRVTWRPTVNPFTLPRRAQVWTPPSAQGLRSWHRMIRAYERIDPQPMRCLTVDSPNHMYLAGEAFIPTHNTLTGAQAIREYARMKPGVQRPDALIAFVAPTPADARDVMIESADGILAISPPSERPTYQPGLRRLTWPNGTKALIFSGAEPADLRGATVGVGWLEELCKWSHLREAWNNYRLALRGGTHPRTVITTTPSRHPLFRELVSGKYPKTDVRRVSTFRNLANLPEEFVADLIQTLDGTTLGRQELYAEILDDVDGALWTQAMIDEARVPSLPAGVTLKKVVVAVDPSGSAGGDECGIVVVGLGTDDEFYVIDDLSLRASPDTWARASVDAFNGHSADRIVAEQNFGASMVEDLIRGIDRRIAYTAVHASRGKMQRAEPVAAFYERGMVHHVGRFPNLERELTEWVPGMTSWSPGRLDATVWGVAYLATFAGHTGNAGMLAPRRRIETVSVNRAAGMLPAGIMAGIASPPRRQHGRIIGSPPSKRQPPPWQEGT